MNGKSTPSSAGKSETAAQPGNAEVIREMLASLAKLTQLVQQLDPDRIVVGLDPVVQYALDVFNTDQGFYSGNITELARKLGVKRQTLYKRKYRRLRDWIAAFRSSQLRSPRRGSKSKTGEIEAAAD